MEQQELIRIICHGHCKFYKEGEKEEMACGTYDAIEASARLQGLLAKLDDGIRNFHRPSGANMELLVKEFCPSCEFYIEGCDFTDPEYAEPEPAVPCGGFIVLVKLMDNGDVEIKEIITNK